MSKATIFVETDSSCEMARVFTRISTLPKGMDKWDFGMEGNYWDFHPHCHGMHTFGEFNSPTSLANAIKVWLVDRGYKVNIVNGTYKY